jgi:hypothetical protein
MTLIFSHPVRCYARHILLPISLSGEGELNATTVFIRFLETDQLVQELNWIP